MINFLKYNNCLVSPSTCQIWSTVDYLVIWLVGDHSCSTCYWVLICIYQVINKTKVSPGGGGGYLMKIRFAWRGGIMKIRFAWGGTE